METRLKIILAFCMGLLVLWAAVFPLVLRAHRGDEYGSQAVAIGGPFTLIDMTGRRVTDQTYRGKWMLIYFGYTFCPDVCPTALNNMSVALEKLGSGAKNLQPLFITVDPKRDTVQVMAEYLKSFDRRIIGLTGTQTQTDDAVKAYGVYVAPQKGDGGDDYLIDHSAYLYLMNSDGKFINVVGGDLPGDQMADRLRHMMAHPGV